MISNRMFVITVTLALVFALVACATPTPTPTRAPVLPTATSAPTVPLAPSPTATLKPTVAPSPTATPKPISLRVAITGDEGILQPYAIGSGYPGWYLMMMIYDTLLIMDTNNQPKPWLATKSQVSADGMTYTLTLRDNVKWHDGKPFTSADVKFSFDYYKKYAVAPRWTTAVATIGEVQAKDATTVVISLARPNPSFVLQVLADIPIIPKHIWESVTEPKTAKFNIGTGPYKVAEYRPNELYRLTAHTDYFAGKPAVDEIVIPIIKEPTTIYSLLKTGELHTTTRSLPPELVKDFQGNPDIQLMRGSVYSSFFLVFNTQRAPWDKREVRQAIAMAIDRQKIVDTVLLGFGTVGNPGFLHPDSPLYDPSANKLSFDVAKAKALLDGLGYKDSDGDGIREADGKKMEGELIVPANQPLRIRVCELIAMWVKEIGISLKVTPLESVGPRYWGKDNDLSKPGDFDLGLHGWVAVVQIDPVRITSLVHSNQTIGSLNIQRYKNPEADKLAEEILATTDSQKQKTLVGKLSNIIAQDLPIVTLYYEDGIYAYRPAVYDRWVYEKGQTIFHKLSFLPHVKP